MSNFSVSAPRTRSFAPFIEWLRQMRHAAKLENRHAEISHLVDRGVSRIRATGVDGRF